MNSKKRKALAPGQYGEPPFNAILSPEGKFYQAGSWEQHHDLAIAVTGEDFDALVMNGWLKVSSGEIHFAFANKDLTQPQIDAIYDYAAFTGVPITEVFDPTTRQEAKRFFGMAS